MIQCLNRFWSFSFILLCIFGTISCSSSKELRGKYSHSKRAKKSRSLNSKTKTASNNKAVTKRSSSRSAKRSKIVEATKKYLGSQYKYGGKSTQSGFDCSGFTAKVYQDNGIAIQGASYEQAKMGKSRPKSAAQPGDLVTFAKNGKVFHVAIITDIDSEHVWVAHSTSSKGVIVNEIWNSNYWRPKIHEFKNVVN